jgi:hypothetical protein
LLKFRWRELRTIISYNTWWYSISCKDRSQDFDGMCRRCFWHLNNFGPFWQSFKQAMRASKNDTGTISKKLAKFLLAYQSTSHQTTNETPSMLLNLIYMSSPFTSCFCFYTVRYRSCFCFIVPDVHLLFPL